MVIKKRKYPVIDRLANSYDYNVDIFWIGNDLLNLCTYNLKTRNRLVK